MSVGPEPTFDLTIGAALAGLAVSAILYGITTGQTLRYYLHHGRGIGTWRTRCFVGVIWCLDTLHMIFVSYVMFHYTVPNHANPAAMLQFLWTYGANLIVTECNTVIVRLGYAHRIWIFNGRKAHMPIVVVFLSLLALALGVASSDIELKTTTWNQVHGLQWMFYLAFALQVSVDSVIVTCMLSVCFRLHTGLQRFDEVIRTCAIFLINTGILSLILNTLCVLFYIFTPKALLFLASYWILGKIHVCSFLAVLNAEQDLAARTATHLMSRNPTLSTAVRVGGFSTELYSTRLESVPLTELVASRGDVTSASIQATYSLVESRSAPKAPAT